MDRKQATKRPALLDLCSRATGHHQQHAGLRALCREETNWQGILNRAEQEGMSPLLAKHIEESESHCPKSVRRSLKILVRQHKYRSLIYSEILEEILDQFRAVNVTPLFIKGSALRYTLYPDPLYRPMRDIDILLHEKDTNIARMALESIGFKASDAPIPLDHFHLPGLYKRIQGVDICIEIHKGLYPNCPPYYPPVEFDSLLQSAARFTINDQPAFTMGAEDTLHYLFQHGFHMPLTYEPYRLINAADLISLVENSFHSFDWPKIRAKHHLLCQALPLLHHISPWNRALIPDEFIPRKEKTKQRSPAPFDGWPLRKFRNRKGTGASLMNFMFKTFYPPRWWLMVYYGPSSRQEICRCLLIDHPRHILWWMRMHYAQLESKKQGDRNGEPSWRLWGMIGGHIRKAGALVKKMMG